MSKDKEKKRIVRHVVLVGTSLIRNTANLLRSDNDLGALARDILKETANEYDYHTDTIKNTIEFCSHATPGEDLECARHATLSSPVFHVLLRILELSPCMISAEINSMDPWLSSCRQQEIPSRIDFIDLLHTDTGNGLLAASVITHFLNEIHGGARMIRVEGFGKPGDMMRGILNLINIIKELAGSSEQIVLLNVTGGFKPESGAALLTGLVHHRVAAAYYIHEAFRDTVILPLTPASKADLGGILKDEGMVQVKKDSPLADLAYAIEPTGQAKSDPPAISVDIANIAVSLGKMLGVSHEAV